MKKSLVALAALAATGAFAQSAVTLYGRLDLGLLSTKTVGNTGAINAPDVTAKTFSLAGAQGVRTGGRLGVRGVEDLGGGLKAGFNIETRVNPDSSASTFGTTRNGNLNLSGGFGTIIIGTYLNSFDDMRGMSVATAGVPGGDFLERNAGGTVLKEALTAAGAPAATVAAVPALGFNSRSENALGYRSPSFGGFVLRANVVNEKVQPGNKLVGFGLAASYDNGPLSVIGVFGTAKLSAVAANGNTTRSGKTDDFGGAVKYDFGIAVPYVQFEQTKTVAGSGPAFTKVRSIEGGSKFPLGAFTPYVSVSTSKHSTDTGGLASSSAFQIGSLYDISKRTYVYAAVGADKTKGTNGATFTSKRNGFATGLVHSF